MSRWFRMWVLLVGGCIENTVSAPGSGNTEDDLPAIEVWPPALEFDVLEMGAAQTLALTVRNIGLAPLDLNGIQLGGTSAFSVASPPNTTLEPEQEISFDVVFSPVNPEDATSLYVYSNDPEVPTVEVPLYGGALVGELLVVPNPLDFGEVPMGCSQTGNVQVMNVGQVGLTIDSIIPLGDSFGAAWDFTLPLSLAPGEVLDVPLAYSPDDLVEDSGEVWITSDAIVGLAIARQMGSGTLDHSVADEWWQGSGPYTMADIAFYVDQSLSMLDDQERLSANFDRFVGILEDLDLDWQIMVVTDESGCSNSGILTRDDADASAIFAASVTGSGGRYTEAGLSLMREAFEDTVPGACNEGFLREDSKTTAVMVSDEPEQSRQSWDHYVGRLRELAPSVGITSIVGDVPEGCVTAEPGTGYVEASLATGGAILSICEEDWASYFEIIGEISANGKTDTFVLSSIPDPSTIAVVVDGSPSTDWTYESVYNAIVFDSMHVPESGVQVQASYDIEADCEE